MYTKHINSAATNNAQIIKKQGTSLYSVNVFNAGGAAAYVKLYNLLVGPTGAPLAPVVGTDVPVMVLAVPAAGNARIDGALAMQFPNGLGLAMVTGAADTDNTAVAAGQIKATLVYGG